MKELMLTGNVVAKVDDDVKEWLGLYNWYAAYAERGKTRPYARRNRSRQSESIYLHRVIAGIPKPWKVKHLDGNPLNCLRENLAIYNKDNTPLIGWHGSCGVSKFRGVNWDMMTGLWVASICDLIIGRYPEEISAALAWNEKIAELGITTEANNLDFLHG